MTPHIEEFLETEIDPKTGYIHDIWRRVPGTDHRTSDKDSQSAKYAHVLLRGEKLYREVKDSNGPTCQLNNLTK